MAFEYKTKEEKFFRHNEQKFIMQLINRKNKEDKMTINKCPICKSIIIDIKHVIGKHKDFISYTCDNCGYYMEE